MLGFIGRNLLGARSDYLHEWRRVILLEIIPHRHVLTSIR